MTFGEGGSGSVAVPGERRPRAPPTGSASQQPPFSAVFSFDTSGSMGNYLPFVYQALRAYTGGVIKGEEAGQGPAVRGGAAAARLERRPVPAPGRRGPVRRRTGGSSGAETALIDASKAARRARGRPRRAAGHRRRDQQLPAEPGAVGRAGERAADGLRGPCRQRRHAAASPATSCRTGRRPVAASTSTSSRTARWTRHSTRMATWLRRPAAYTLDLSTSEVELPPPPPGTLVGDGRRWSVARRRAHRPARTWRWRSSSTPRAACSTGSAARAASTIAKQVLDDLVTNELPAGRAHRAARPGRPAPTPAAPALAVPFGPLDAGRRDGARGPAQGRAGGRYPHRCRARGGARRTWQAPAAPRSCCSSPTARRSGPTRTCAARTPRRSSRA